MPDYVRFYVSFGDDNGSLSSFLSLVVITLPSSAT